MSSPSDWALLARLRIRHTRTFLVRLLYVTGSDFTEDRSFSDRWYQIYVLLIIGAAFVMMWFFLLDYTERVFAAAGAAAALRIFDALLLTPPLIFCFIAVRSLRSSWVKMSHPDAAYIGASPISSRAIVGNALTVAWAKILIVSALVGYVAGTGLAAVIPTSPPPLAVAFMTALGVCAAFALGRLVGMARLVTPKNRRRRAQTIGILCVILLAIAAGAATLSVGHVLVGDALVIGVCAVALVLLALATAAILFVAPRIDIVTVVEDSALYADLQPLGMLSPFYLTALRDYRRRHAAARRRPTLRLSGATGAKALVARAALSIVRQCEGLGNLLLFGCIVVPFGAVMLSGTLGFFGLLFWLVATIVFTRGPKEMTRVFRSDMRTRLIRDRLPFETLSMLAFDSLPAFVIVVIATTVVTLALSPIVGIPVLTIWGLSLAIIIGSVLSCGLEAIRLSVRGPKLSAEAGLAILAIAMDLASLMKGPLPAIFVGFAACALLAYIVRSGVEMA